uniref:Uncharacterized protein n=1 Tax=Anguilla anguilla TaxID=7936 RepID=A0A0E9RHK7_ANGAN
MILSPCMKCLSFYLFSELKKNIKE